VAITQLSESLQHANVRLWFGRIGERLWVSPRFHRLHHSIGIGHETVEAERHPLGGHNFGVLLPWWDVLFGTANFEQRYDPTGIRDQVEAKRDYGKGFWSQQWVGLVRWLETLGLGGLRVVLAPALLLFLAIPVIVIVSMLFVAMLMTPAMVSLVAERRFPQLERKLGGSMMASLFWSLGSTLLAVVALVVSIPLWLIPPLILVLPPLIWGWLTYRVMSYDALVDHASSEERRQIFKEHRAPLLAIGVLSGYLGAAPSLIWASGAMFVAMALGLIIVGDEILSGKRADKHLPKLIELLGARGLQLAWAEYVGDDPERITATLARAFEARRHRVLLRRHRRHARRPHPPVRGQGAGR
jgi:hypothetical protein